MSLAAWLNQTIHVAAETGRDAYGKPSYGTPRPMQARVEERRAVVHNAQGEESLAQHRLWTLEPVALTDRLWLPGISTSSADASHLPLTASSSSDRSGGRTLYKVEL